MSETPKTFTGIRREKRTPKRVFFADRAAQLTIMLGGIGTIVAVLTVCIFLVWVVAPLFQGGELDDAQSSTLEALDPELVNFTVDEYRVMGFAISPDGAMTVIRLDTGKVLARRQLDDRAPITALSFSPGSFDCGVAYADGMVRLGTVGFSSRFLNPSELTPEVLAIEPGAMVEWGGGMVQRTPIGQFRLQSVDVALEPPVDAGVGAPLVAMDQTLSPYGRFFTGITADGRLVVRRVTKEVDVFAGGETTVAEGAVLEDQETFADPVFRLLISSLGDAVYGVWRSGRVVRVDARDHRAPRVVETLQATEAEVTAAEFLLGRSSILIGDRTGALSVWFRTKPEDAAPVDGQVLARGHLIQGRSSPIRRIASSSRSRLVVLGYEDGALDVFHVTSEARVVETPPDDSSPLLAVGVSPKDDGLVALHRGHLRTWSFDPGYPEASMGALFTPVWYESYDEPAYVWQSSAGTDDQEPKLSLIPLIFGTIKATIYSLLFGVPIALLAAIFTSEFLRPRHKARIKPTIELMASLPSVVLGFFAALVISPFIESRIPAVIASFATVPLFVLMGAQFWQALPSRLTIRYQGWRLVFITLTIPAGLWFASLVAPTVESRLFGGDMKLWLDGQVGTGLGGWFLIFLPLSVAVAWFFCLRVVNPRLRLAHQGMTRGRAATIEAAKLIFGFGFTVGLSLAIGFGLTRMGFDPRGSFLGTYVQRNALVVGFVMGFAIIPIIYTIAEDALSTVPGHLRAASLGCGATPWQTTTRVVIPAAMSGLFSAVMIGLGRAVGETMIVLMAAGNTAIMDWNIFNGFRTLSANIAEELPEAVRNSTHYRTLFLAALSLFVMTFVLNTLAEVVRQRYRKRAVQL